MADFFNTKKFPGKRGLRKSPKANLEMALVADGVAAADVYDVLATSEGVDRAFAKLDSIKDSVVWWESGAQPPQLVGAYNSDPDLEMGPHMPTAPANFMNAIANGFEFWADNQDELNERFNAWLAS